MYEVVGFSVLPAAEPQFLSPILLCCQKSEPLGLVKMNGPAVVCY